MGNEQSSQSTASTAQHKEKGPVDISTLPTSKTLPEQFITQAHVDWKAQITELYKRRPTVTRTVILPPGTTLDDERLTLGKVTKETRSVIVGDEVYAGWPVDAPFEVDVDGSLLPPCRGIPDIHAHYAVYPDQCFAELQCGYCELHKKAYPEEEEKVKNHPVALAMQGIEAHAPMGSFHDGHLTEEEQDVAVKLIKAPSQKDEPVVEESPLGLELISTSPQMSLNKMDQEPKRHVSEGQSTTYPESGETESHADSIEGE